jgi:hypothetical protein
MSTDSVSNPDLGGSGLAREDGSTVNIDAICPTAFASKLNWSSNSGHQLRFHAASFSIATGDR